MKMTSNERLPQILKVIYLSNKLDLSQIQKVTLYEISYHEVNGNYSDQVCLIILNNVVE